MIELTKWVQADDQETYLLINYRGSERVVQSIGWKLFTTDPKGDIELAQGELFSERHAEDLSRIFFPQEGRLWRAFRAMAQCFKLGPQALELIDD